MRFGSIVSNEVLAISWNSPISTKNITTRFSLSIALIWARLYLYYITSKNYTISICHQPVSNNYSLFAGYWAKQIAPMTICFSSSTCFCSIQWLIFV